jgi:hypothetical protein
VVADYSNEISQIKGAKSIRQIIQIAEQFSAEASGPDGVLFGDWIGSANRAAFLIRHPEVRAKRALKDTAEARGPSPFEGRFAATSG